MRWWQQRIEHIDKVRTAYIMWQDLPIATISEEYSSLEGESDWVITPIWENIEKAKTERGEIIDIAGVDLFKHQDEYIFQYYLPCFIEQRVIPKGRPDLRHFLDVVKLPGYDLFEMMCRSHAVCGNDDLYVSRTPDRVIDVYKYPIPLDIP